MMFWKIKFQNFVLHFELQPSLIIFVEDKLRYLQRNDMNKSKEDYFYGAR